MKEPTIVVYLNWRILLGYASNNRDYESEFTRNRPYMDKGQRKFWLMLRLSSR